MLPDTFSRATGSFVAICVGLLLIFSMPLLAEEEGSASLNKLVDMSLEELMQVEVTSVSRKPEVLADAASAIFVVTQDDIRRSGALSIPEALRYVPGLQVARLDGNKWAISARGGNGLFANRLLVLMDGRTLYTPLFSGVWWDVQDTMMDDIERIEIIRGPGAAMWGANAVNGVINIITRHARDTQGVALNAVGGNKEHGRVSARFGTALGDNTHVRLYGSHFNRQGFRDDLTLEQGSDEQEQNRGGFRLESDLPNDNQVTLQGDFYEGESGGNAFSFTQRAFPYNRTAATLLNAEGQNVLGRWSKRLSPSSNFALQVYWDRATKLLPNQNIAHEQNTYDVDFQHTLDYSDRHHIVWGGGYRVVHSVVNGNFFFDFSRPTSNRQIFNLFVQDDITLIPNRLRLSVGSKFEHNDYSGMEPQPSARLTWTPSSDHTVWAAVSRAVRIPALVEDGIRANVAVVPEAFPVLVSVLQQSVPKTIELIAAELGYRARWSERLSIDIASYYHMYNDIGYMYRGPCFVDNVLDRPHVTCPLNLTNSTDTATSYGVEIAGDARLLPNWRVRMGYTYQQLDNNLPVGAVEGLTTTPGSPDPKHQFYMRSSLDLPHDTSFDLGLRYVHGLTAFSLPPYVTLDARLAWKPSAKLELALVGQNLVEDPHQEFGSQVFFPATSVSPSYFGQIRWQF